MDKKVPFYQYKLKEGTFFTDLIRSNNKMLSLPKQSQL